MKLRNPTHSTVLSLALVSDDPWAVALGCEDGGVHVSDLRRPDAPVASAAVGSHGGPGE